MGQRNLICIPQLTMSVKELAEIIKVSQRTIHETVDPKHWEYLPSLLSDTWVLAGHIKKAVIMHLTECRDAAYEEFKNL